jgi:hypothetical protein
LTCRSLAAGVAVAVTMVGLTSAPGAAAGVALAHGSVSGTVTSLDGSLVTVHTPGRRTGVVDTLTRAATKITRQDYPYVYGGGHSRAGVASVGIPGPGYNGRRRGYDCSGSVAAVLVAGGLWPAGTGVPNEAWMIRQLRDAHLIVKGAGKGPVEVTLYDDPGSHIFMNIDGRFFGTSDGEGSGNRRGGAGWLNDGAPDATAPWFKRYHFRPSALRGSLHSGHDVTFDLGTMAPLMEQLRMGEKLRVSYQERQSAKFIATTIRPPHGSTVSGTVSLIAIDGSTFTLQESGGHTRTFATATDPAALKLISLGEQVRVTYTRHGSQLNARLVTVPPGAGWPGAGGSDGDPRGHWGY